MKIAILSDSHDQRPLLRLAMEQAVERGAEAVLHCGDLVTPSTLEAVRHLTVPMHIIHGNNTGDLYALTRLAHRHGSHIQYYGQDAGLELHGRRIFMVHYPHYARAMGSTGDWDLVCCGHDHHAAIDWVDQVGGGRTLLVNPGTVGGVAAPATWAFGDLDTLSFEILAVEDSPVAQKA